MIISDYLSLPRSATESESESRVYVRIHPDVPSFRLHGRRGRHRARLRNRGVAEPGWLPRTVSPISDQEFLARCRPGTSPEVALKVRRIVAEHLAVKYEQIYPSTRFIEDLGAD